jgi:GPH family glycoside/pentoside/hexuronide:cation symporter
MCARQAKEFTVLEGLALLLSCIAIQLISEVMTQWGTYFYSPPAGEGDLVFVAITLAGTMFVITYLFSACADPLFALWSDKTRTRPGKWRFPPIAGRRRPFIFWGSIGVTFTGILFWYPPVRALSVVNFVYATAILCVHWGVFSSMCSVPFNALGPEIARSKEARVKIGTWIAAGMILGLAIAEIMPGILVDLFDPSRAVTGLLNASKALDAVAEHAALGPLLGPPARFSQETFRPASLDIFSVFKEYQRNSLSPVGFQRMAILFSIVSFVFFQFTVWTVRERYQSTEASMSTPAVAVIRQTFSNLVFLRYIAIFFLFNLGYLAVQRVLPYWVMVGLHGTTSTVSLLMAPYIACALAALAFTQPLAKYIPIKWLVFISLGIITSGLPMMYVIAVSGISPAVKTVLGASLFAYCGIGQGMQYVLLTPMIGEIIDLDERRSGERREAIYQSVSGLAWKGSQALSVYVATLSMHFWGNSVEHPTGIFLVGPIAGVFGVLAMAVCWTYPVLRVTKEAAAKPGEAV